MSCYKKQEIELATSTDIRILPDSERRETFKVLIPFIGISYIKQHPTGMPFMNTILLRRFIIAGCLLCIALTIFFKSRVHEITNPAWLLNQKAATLQTDYQPTITLHYHERRPYYIKTGNEVQGLVAGIVARAFQFAEIPYRWQETPATRQLDIIKRNESFSCGLGWFKTPERETYARFTIPIYQDTPFVAVARSDNNMIQKMNSLDQLFAERRLTLLVKSGYSYGSLIDQKIRALSPWKVETTAGNHAILQMIEAHRADYCFMTREEANDLFMHAGFNSTNFSLIPFPEMPLGNKRYLICSKKVDGATIAQLNLALSFLQDKDRRKP